MPPLLTRGPGHFSPTHDPPSDFDNRFFADLYPPEYRCCRSRRDGSRRIAASDHNHPAATDLGGDHRRTALKLSPSVFLSPSIFGVAVGGCRFCPGRFPSWRAGRRTSPARPRHLTNTRQGKPAAAAFAGGQPPQPVSGRPPKKNQGWWVGCGRGTSGAQQVPGLTPPFCPVGQAGGPSR